MHHRLDFSSTAAPFAEQLAGLGFAVTGTIKLRVLQFLDNYRGHVWALECDELLTPEEAERVRGRIERDVFAQVDQKDRTK